MLEASRYLASTLELDELLPAIFEQLQRVVEFGGASVSLVEGDSTFTLLDYLVPGSEPVQPRRLQATAGEAWLEENLAQFREPFIIPDILADTSAAANWRKKAARSGRSLAGIRAWMGVPLPAVGRCLA